MPKDGHPGESQMDWRHTEMVPHGDRANGSPYLGIKAHSVITD